MPTITRVSWRPFAIPLKQAFGAAHGTTSVREGVLLRIDTDEGYVGLGEASPLPTFVPGTVADVLERLPRLFTDNLEWEWRSDEIFSGFQWDASVDSIWGAASSVNFAFQSALGDISAQAAGLPFFRWFASAKSTFDSGELDHEIEPSPTVPVNAVIGGLSAGLAAEQAKQQLVAGYSTFKVKVGLEPIGDIARVLAVRNAIGSGCELRIDANGGWAFDDAVWVLEQLHDAGVTVLEQPVPVSEKAFQAFEELARRFPGVAIAADESLQAYGPAARWHNFLGESHLPNLGTVLKPMIVQLDEIRCIIGSPRVHGPVIVTTTIDAGIATAAAMHLAACLPRPRPACGLSTLDMLEGDIVTGVPPVVNGAVTLPETPGLGVTLDEAALEHYATGPWEEGRR